jgi:hypothetical protein
MKNSGRTNVVGHIKDYEVFLIDTHSPLNTNLTIGQSLVELF